MHDDTYFRLATDLRLFLILPHHLIDRTLAHRFDLWNDVAWYADEMAKDCGQRDRQTDKQTDRRTERETNTASDRK